jgi:hypothetical protein
MFGMAFGVSWFVKPGRKCSLSISLLHCTLLMIFHSQIGRRSRGRAIRKPKERPIQQRPGRRHGRPPRHMKLLPLYSTSSHISHLCRSLIDTRSAHIWRHCPEFLYTCHIYIHTFHETDTPLGRIPKQYVRLFLQWTSVVRGHHD